MNTGGGSGIAAIEPFVDRIIEGDALAVLAELPEKSVDLVLTDPPYNISTDFTIEFSDRSTISHDFGEWDHDKIFPPEWVPAVVRTLTDTGVFVSLYDNRTIHQLVRVLEAEGLELRQKAYWHKQNPTPQIYGVKWQEAVEELVVATRNEGRGHHFRAERGQRHNVVTTPICQGSERHDHPTQKPKRLFRPFIQWWSEPGDVILDPFAGTGTVCVVAQELGRHYIGIEQQEAYVETARHRLEQQSLHQY